MKTKTNSGATVIQTVSASMKKVAKSKAKTPGEKSSHPPTSEMVTGAIKELKDRKRSSLQAIKKYIASTYKLDGDKSSPFIKRYLKAAVISGVIVQTKGKRASGSFKLFTGKSSEGPKPKTTAPCSPKKARSVEKKTAPKKRTGTKKRAQAKKSIAEKKTVAPKKPADKPTAKSKAATEAKNLSRLKKNTKAPAAKIKVPKP